MKLKKIFKVAILACLILLYGGINHSYADDGYDLWLKYNKISDAQKLAEYQEAITSVVVMGDSPTCKVIEDELRKGLSGLLGMEVPFSNSVENDRTLVIGTPENSDIIKNLDLTVSLKEPGKEGYLIKSMQVEDKSCIIITANEDVGLLYGTFGLLRLIQTNKSLNNLNIISKPKIQYRLLNHWDMLNLTAGRGFGGRSTYNVSELPDKVDPRIIDYARANASIGINGIVPNIVNANPEIIMPENLEKMAKLADIFRPYGIQLFLSANFSSPLSGSFARGRRSGGIGDLDTADPLDPKVRQWWKDKVKEIYEFIPDFGGFVVKANSEGEPGPQDYNRTHTEGANLLAEALEPYGGIVMWRAFVYDADVDPDRFKRAYMEFVPLDGQFKPNVFVQVKNGPIDFQPREPVHPLFGAMPKTPLMLELQIVQEYLGGAIQLVYLAPMWKEYLEFDTYSKGQGSTMCSVIDGTLHNYEMSGIVGVANTNNQRNWCGHFFAQSNWYAFGRLAWDHTLDAEAIADEWIRMSISNDDDVVKTINSMMMGTWEACINYMTPLGLHHIFKGNVHYGPEPSYATASREDWNSVYYHRADSNGVGFNRSSTGSNATSQYFSPWKERFDDIETCPEKYLLWFHHVNWDYKLKSGNTLWDELCIRYQQGTDYVEQMAKTWQSLEGKIDPEIFAHVEAKLKQHIIDSAEWRDVCIKYFQDFSKLPIPDSVEVD